MTINKINHARLLFGFDVRFSPMPHVLRFCCYSCLLQSFIKSIMPAYRSALLFNSLFTFCQWLVIAGLVAVVVFSFAVFVLLRKTSFFMDSQNYYCLFMDSEKSAICSPFALCARLWCGWYVCLSNGLTWRYGVSCGVSCLPCNTQ